MPTLLKNALLVLFSVVLCTAAAEGLVRWLEAEAPSDALKHLAEIPLAEGVQRAWFGENPAPLPNRQPARPEDIELIRRVEASGVTEGTRRSDMFKAWNSAFVGPDPCKHFYLKDAPGQIYVYDPADGERWPRFRFLPNRTTPIGLVTNEYGFRGPPVPVARQPKTIRIAFIGASTTVSSHNFLYSYPEHVGYWLNRWAAAKKLDLRFEVLNAGRESIASPDIAAIMKNEVAPLSPDLVVYYEGANQFFLQTIVPDMPPPQPSLRIKPQPEPGLLHRVLVDLGYTFALARRLENFLAQYGSAPGEKSGDARGDATARAITEGREWPKPDYKVVWPKGLDEKDPDIARVDLPVNLATILADLGRIDATARKAGGELAIASYKWLVSDGMVLDPARHRLILEYLNYGYAPFRYRDLERLALFQNRVLEKFARLRGIDFLDVARLMPSDPDLFVDAIHGTPEGERLRAWIVLQLLVPVIDRHLADGTWPKKSFPDAPPLQPYAPRVVTFDCRNKSG
ncbi:hypothetical protein LJ725_20000 [Reyranella aquatilis]|uniref:SGNH/GDSL hydrolase family protein n=1 Tax=Reyranella aquatilis TaxID=2035356 RepID=A0ABS8KYV2_9HYPH|nr:hypothetical protein [Reyranella aquatilis]MCC8431264.1 hypothetical protein [Reyranella aquatilis]